MKIIRYVSSGQQRFGAIEDGRVREIGNDPFVDKPVFVGSTARAKIKALAPCKPGKIVAVGLNYRDHALEMGRKIPSEPLLFLKPSTAVIGPEDPIEVPLWAGRVDYEAELGIVIGKRARRVKREQAHEVILGYCCINDVTARELQRRDVQYTRAKGFDSFAPLGPCIETELDPADLRVQCFLNGECKQDSRTSQFIFPPDFLIEHISNVMTLEPGDVISTGTAGGVGPLSPGDVVEVRIQGVGSLVNPVIQRQEEQHED
ncbi:MAG: fumarylacetoacetate hydrolase family protein [Candidatus Alcyoniella australis]|nr:fumarylacetoacetate hydrolase family protein [Candidatus Alcyoniella australis]